MPGVSGVGDVELSADEEGDRRRAAADDLVRLFVAQDQPEGEIMNDVLFIAKAESGKGRTNCVNKSVALMRSMRARSRRPIINLFPVHCPEARFQGAAHQLVQIHGHLKRRSGFM